MKTTLPYGPSMDAQVIVQAKFTVTRLYPTDLQLIRTWTGCLLNANTESVDCA